MKKLMMILLAAFCLGFMAAAAEAGGAALEPAFTFVQPGEDFRFTYTVPDGYEVQSEEWSWTPAFTADLENVIFLQEQYGEGVVWKGEGVISLPEGCMVRVQLRLNGSDYLYGYAAAASPEEAFTYEIAGGEATITGRTDNLLGEMLIIPETLGGCPVTAIGDRAFRDLPSGTGSFLWIPDTVTRIGEEAFAASAYVSVAYLSRNLTSMGEGAFGACLQLRDIVIPDSLKEIPAEAFANCWGLGTHTDIQRFIGRCTEKIGARAFMGCYTLESGNGLMPETLSEIGEGAFHACRKLTELTLPSGITQIADNAFKGCEKLTAIVFRGAVTELGPYAFDGCKALTSIDLTNAQSIGSAALRGCISLTEIELSSRLQYIGAQAFADCTGITAFSVPDENGHFAVVGGALMDKALTRLISYPASAPAASFTAPETMTSAEEGAFHHLRFLKELTLPEGFCDYRESMFFGSAGLECIRFPEGALTDLPARFFYGCTSLTYPTVFSGINSIGREAFSGCASLKSAEFDTALSMVDAYAFENCTALESVKLGSYTGTIGTAAFSGCSSLTVFTLPGSLKEIPDRLFKDCAALKTVEWNNSLVSIGNNAFEGTALTALTLPASLKSIGSAAFANNASLVQAILPDGLERISSSAFRSTNLTEIILPESLTHLGSAAFMNCASLKTAVIGSGITVLPVSVFEGCAALSAPALPRSIAQIGSRAFAGCASIGKLTVFPETEQIASDAFTGCTGLNLCGWKGTAVHAAAQAADIAFTALDAELTYTLNASQDGYILTGCDADAWLLEIPALHEELPVTGVAPGAFEACATLRQITVDENSLFLSSQDGILYSADGKTLLLCPAGYPQATLHVAEQVTAIADFAFAGNRMLSAITIEDQVASIGENAFRNANANLTLFVNEGSPAHAFAVAAGIAYMTENMQFTSRVENEKVIITGYTGSNTHVVIPSEIDGLPVYAVEGLSAGVTTVVFSDSVEIIGENAFAYHEQLSGVTLGKGLREIGAKAFSNCTALTELALPESLTTIGNAAFSGSGLKKLRLPKNVSSIGFDAFSSCPALTGVEADEANPVFSCENGMLYNNVDQALIYCAPGLSGEVTVRPGTLSIGSRAFENLDEITGIILPDGLKEIGTAAMKNCRALHAITLPDGLQSIDSSAFANCSQLKTINLPDSLTHLGASAFAGCAALNHVSVPSGVKYLYGTFYACYALTDVTLSEGVTALYDSVFESCRALRELHLPSTVQTFNGRLPQNLETLTIAPGCTAFRSEQGVVYDVNANSILFVNAGVQGEITLAEGITAIGDSAFRNRAGLTAVSLPDTLTSIGREAFYGCTGLRQVVFPKGLTNIGYSAFYGSGLTEVSLTGSALTHIASFAFANCPDLTQAVITTENVFMDECLFDDCTGLKSAVLPETVGRMSSGCFNDCTALETVSLPQNITLVDGFENCTSLKSITIPESAAEIGRCAFRNCTSLTEVLLPSGLVSIGESAFDGCYQLHTAVLPTGLRTLGARAFCATALTQVNVPEGVTEIPAEAFAYITELEGVTLPKSLTVIGRSAFENAESLTEITLPDNLTHIGERAFYASGLTTVLIPEKVQELGSYAFALCPALRTAEIAVGVESIGSGAFRYSRALETVALPPTVRTIGEYAFMECEALSKVVCSAGAGIESIGGYAFYQCKALAELPVSDNLNQVGEYAFFECSKLRRVSSSAEKTGAQLMNVRSIGNSAFAGCSALSGVTLGEALTQLDAMAFDRTTFTSIHFPDSLTAIGDNAIWRNPYLSSVSLPENLTRIPSNMFASVIRLESLVIPSGTKTIGAYAFLNNTSLGALKLPEGVETIESGAFMQADIRLSIPDSVTDIADDAFDGANAVIYASEGSYAHQYAQAKGIPVNTDAPLNEDYLLSGDQIASRIVSQVIKGNMTDYQKAEALVDWMLTNVEMDDMIQDTIAGKQALIMRKSSRWGWSYAYDALMRAAGLHVDIYHTHGGYIESEAIVSNGAVTVTYFSGEAVNMVKINGEWYFTHPAFTEYYGKADYFMLNRDRYFHAFGEYPEVPDCSGYEHTYLYQEFSLEIETEVTARADAEFENGQKLVFAGVEIQNIPYADVVLSYAGMHMDTLEWTFSGERFAPTIVGTAAGYWLSGDLTDEYAEVNVVKPIIRYGETMTGEITYTAVLCGLEVEGTLTLTEITPEVRKFSLMRAAPGSDAVFTKNRTYQATFTPMLSAYIDTLEPTEFMLTLECILPPVSDDCTVDPYGITVALAEDHIFPDGAQLEITIVPDDEDMETMYIRVPDSPEYYENGIYTILFEPGLLNRGAGYTLYIARTAENCTPSEPRLIGALDSRKPHLPVYGTVTPAFGAQDGYVGRIVCSECGAELCPETTVSAQSVLNLPEALERIENEAFLNSGAQQIILPSRTTVIGSRAFAQCASLRLILIPESVTEIAPDAFKGSEQVILLCSENSAAFRYAAEIGLMHLPFEGNP